MSLGSPAGALLYLYALTSLHPGVGRGGEFVDLPVQRDEFGYPVVWASSIKGSLRSQMRDKLSDGDVKAIFGPEPGEGSEYASSVIFQDARLLLLTARSLKGVWIYITSGHLLSYLESHLEALEALGVSSDNIRSIKENLDSVQKMFDRISDGKALVSSGDYLVNGKVIINEEVLDASVDEQLLKSVKGLLHSDLRDKVRGIALLSDNDFNSINRKSLILQYRIRLDYSKKTVVPGGLWGEEHIPQRTIFISLAASWNVKKESENIKTPENVIEKLSSVNFLNIGGKETVGKGMVMLRWLR